MPESKLSDIIATSLSSIKELADANTIIGEPINAGKTTIIPVSRVSVGFASGGVDYFGKGGKAAQSSASSNGTIVNGNGNGKNAPLQNFGGGGGTGLTVTPICFLIIKPDDVELLTIAEPHSPGAAGIIEAVGSLIERSPELVSKLRKAFAKDDSSDNDP
ncbi:MAG: GerW family sporulation protein, partial [Bacillota bacterium]